LLFASYAFMPNKLGYCGGDDNRTLFEYCVARQTDPGLVTLLQKFQAAYPYLKLIARANHIMDPFDARVVEAYWIGNELLDAVDLAQFYGSLQERFSKQLSPKVMGYLLSKVPQGARAHHSFHVFDVHARTGTLDHGLETMENCRIGWGRVKEAGATHFVVEHRPLVMSGGKLQLGDLTEKQVLRQINGYSFIADPRPDDYLSFHWGWACQLLEQKQVQTLEKFTKYHLALANQTL
jgi:hypothetical protein